jgi:hypothetical protein
MRKRRALAWGAAALLVPLAAVAQVCGSQSGKPGVTEATVQLQALPRGPSFYYRARDYVVFLPAEAVLAQLTRSARAGNGSAEELAGLIRADTPLTANKDLFAYVIRDWFYARSIEDLVIELAKRGEAAVSNLDGAQLDTLTVVSDRQFKSSVTEVFAGKKGEDRIFAVKCVGG